jgi:hypothetical protein
MNVYHDTDVAAELQDARSVPHTADSFCFKVKSQPQEFMQVIENSQIKHVPMLIVHMPAFRHLKMFQKPLL